MRKVLVYLGMLGACAVLGAAAVGTSYLRFLNGEITLSDGEQTFIIESGASFTRVNDDLVALGVITHPTFYRLHARLTGQAASIQAGEYTLESGLTPKTLLQRFTRGSVVLHSFTIVEGWNHWELLDALQKSDVLVDDLHSDGWRGFLESLGSEYDYPEGLFLPETYRFPRGTTFTQLLSDAHEDLLQTLAEEWDNRASDAAVTTPYEALTLASIIEKETARADERERISGVFTRRLNKRMRLQTDPTVIYGLMPTFNGDLTRRDLRTDTPYNTYTRRGLPPTPIAMAGRAAIHAALHPADGEELYFVATGLGDGSHKFSVTNEEHNEAVQEYLKRLRAKRRGDGT